MKRSGNILRSLRRRRASMGRLVLILFAFAAASAGAAPCFAMAATDGAVHQDNAPAPVTAHADSHAAGHDHAATGDHHQKPHSPCPHCPMGAAASANASSGSHAFCSAGDDASDGAKPTWSPPALKDVLSTALIQLLPQYRPPRFASALQPRSDAALPSVALNLRHCVLLI